MKKLGVEIIILSISVSVLSLILPMEKISETWVTRIFVLSGIINIISFIYNTKFFIKTGKKIKEDINLKNFINLVFGVILINPIITMIILTANPYNISGLEAIGLYLIILYFMILEWIYMLMFFMHKITYIKNNTTEKNNNKKLILLNILLIIWIFAPFLILIQNTII